MALFEIKRLSPALGAQVIGVDFTKPLSAEQRQTIEQLLLQYQVLFFRQPQVITPTQQAQFALQFGELHIHPIYPQAPEQPEIIIIDTHGNNPPDSDNWHTDVTFVENPPLGAVLSAQLLPELGGDTVWSSNSAAYEALSPSIQRALEGLWAIHDFTGDKAFPEWRFARTPEERQRWEVARANNPQVRHPVVRTHPVTGRKGLFVNEGFTRAIEGLSALESQALLNLLFQHSAKPEFTVRWSWQLGDVAFWDNRITQHYAVADYLPVRRIMHRATIIGDRPY